MSLLPTGNLVFSACKIWLVPVQLRKNILHDVKLIEKNPSQIEIFQLENSFERAGSNRVWPVTPPNDRNN